MRWFVLFLAAAFFGTLAAVVGGRAVAEMQSFVAGIVCGVAASVPASVLAYFVSRVPVLSEVREPRQEPGYPPVVMVGAPAVAQTPPPPSFVLPAIGDATTPLPPYRVVGEE